MEEKFRLMAVKKLLDDRDVALLARLETRSALRDALNADAAVRRQVTDIVAAGRVFGQLIAAPADEAVYNSRKSLSAAMAALRGGREWKPGESEPVPNSDPPPVAADLHTTTASPPPAKEPRIRDITLECLRAAAPSGMKSAEIRSLLANTHNIKTHEKTVGMTLYRLSTERLVRRSGRTWFFVPPDAGTENPGGDTPGPINPPI